LTWQTKLGTRAVIAVSHAYNYKPIKFRIMNNITIYIDNSREIYALTEWLEKCVAKRMAKGQAVTVDHLVNCSTMRKIVGMAAKMNRENDSYICSKEEKQEAAKAHAQYIIECAEYLAKND
jgi:hypothetical protein